MEDEDKPWHLHVCKHCPYRTTSTLNMCKHVRRHRRKHESETFTCDSRAPENYECEFCEFETDLKVRLKEHLRVSHENKQVNEAFQEVLYGYQCKSCDFRTNSLFVITRHVRTNCHRPKAQVDWDKWFGYKSEGLKWFRCKFCSHETVNKEAIKCHVRTQHMGIKGINSFEHDPVIIANYVDTKDMSWYEGYGTGRTRAQQGDINWWKCDQCSFECKTKHTLKSHVSIVHGNAEDISWFKCEQCTYKSPFKYRLKLHCLRRHLDSMFKCNQCSFATKVECILKQHVMTNHNTSEHNNGESGDADWYEYRTFFGFKCFQCKHCSYQARGKAIMRNHMMSKHCDGKDITWLKCDYCPYKCIQKGNLNTHVVSMHSDPETQKWFQCEQCSYKSTKKICLKNHIIAKHAPPDDVKWFKCKNCPYKAKFARELKVHSLRKHSDPVALNLLMEKQGFLI